MIGAIVSKKDAKMFGLELNELIAIAAILVVTLIRRNWSNYS